MYIYIDSNPKNVEKQFSLLLVASYFSHSMGCPKNSVMDIASETLPMTPNLLPVFAGLEVPQFPAVDWGQLGQIQWIDTENGR